MYYLVSRCSNMYITITSNCQVIPYNIKTIKLCYNTCMSTCEFAKGNRFYMKLNWRCKKIPKSMQSLIKYS